MVLVVPESSSLAIKCEMRQPTNQPRLTNGTASRRWHVLAVARTSALHLPQASCHLSDWSGKAPGAADANSFFAAFLE